MAISVLLVGESWQTVEYHVKGFDSFSTASYTEAITPLRTALENNGIETTYQPCHVAATDFPETPAEIAEYDVVLLSDIGYNTLAIPPSTFTNSEKQPDRLRLVEDFVRGGGGLVMVGGYLSFQGIEGKAGYYGTAIENTLPVSLQSHDDRVERSAGVVPDIVVDDHDIVADIDEDWPNFLGYNRVQVNDDATEVVRIDDDPLVAVGSHGDGRSAVFTSDCAPHWGPPEFLDWPHYETLWANLVSWAGGL